jgi:DnaJ-class molecular chaperone
MLVNHFVVLGVNQNASSEAIELSYRRKTTQGLGQERSHYPDDVLKQAYEVLIDPRSRTAHYQEVRARIS